MKSCRANVAPARLETVRRRLEAWRRSRRGRERIPEPRWNLAVQMAGVYGLCTTARTLRLDYVVLKRRVESAHRQSPPRPEPAMSFVEVLSPERTSVPECILEMENPSGAKMRVHLKGIPVPDLTALSRSLWNAKA